MKRIFVVCIFLATWLCMEGQSMEISVSRVPLQDSDGSDNVIGAVFYEDKELFFVQHTIMVTENNGLVFRSNRQLSSWNLTNNSMITKRIFDRTPNPKAFPCGRVEKSLKLHRVFLCSAESYLEVVDPDNLATVGTIARVDDQTIRDFAVDDQRDRILVLSIREGKAIYLSSYSLSTGEKQHETVLPSTNITSMGIAIAPQTGEIGIAIDITYRNRGKADIYLCNDYSTNLVCEKIAQTDEAGQIGFLERQLLVVPFKFADNKKDCILSVDIMTGEVSRAYCSKTGVHYALAVVEGKYVVGFTGVSKRNWFLEENRSVSSSYSVWKAGVSEAAAVVKDPNDYGSFQIDLTLVGSNLKPFFILYKHASNMLYLYSIRE